MASLLWREAGRVSLQAAIGLFVALAAALGARSLYRYLAPREAVVGTDGVAVRGIRRAFVPYASVEGLERDGHGVRLRLRGGESLLLPVRARAYSALPPTATEIPPTQTPSPTPSATEGAAESATPTESAGSPTAGTPGTPATAVAGEEHPWTALLPECPPLLIIPARQIGCDAAELLLRRLRGEPPATPRTLVIPMRFERSRAE